LVPLPRGRAVRSAEGLIEKLSGNCVFSACAGQAEAYQRSVFRIGTCVRYPRTLAEAAWRTTSGNIWQNQSRDNRTPLLARHVERAD